MNRREMMLSAASLPLTTSCLGITKTENIDQESDLLQPQKIWVLSINTEYGLDTSLYKTEESALEYLYSYVKEWWDEEACNQGFDEEDDDFPQIPENREEAIQTYFNELTYTDSVTLEELEVQ